MNHPPSPRPGASRPDSRLHQRPRRSLGSYAGARSVGAVALVVVLAMVGSACRVSEQDAAFATAERAERPAGQTPAGGENETPEPSGTIDPEPTPSDPPLDLPRDLGVADVTCAPPSIDDPIGLADDGVTMFERHIDTGAAVPTYSLAVDVDPGTGQVGAAMRAVVPAQDRSINFRVFAGMEAFDSGLAIENVRVDGESVDMTLNQALLTVPAPALDRDETVVEMDFSFTIDQMAANENLFGAFTGETLQPDQVGLLGRTDTGMQLGHWFPVWLPDTSRTDPDPSGFGDIGAFPAANICATITVPPGYQVVTGGSRVDTTDTSIVEAAAGIRDFSMVISNDLLLAARFVRGVQVRVWGPASDPDALGIVLDFADRSQVALTDAFGPYPWTEIDIISTPLGAGVGGMEWPGAIWIEQSMFAGGVPGLGDLGGLDELFGDGEFDSLFGALGGEALATTLEWTIAHELGHEWWHATVGNDSIESPAVDEPLAQFAACVAMQAIHPDNWRDVCEAQTIDQFAQARALGIPDTVAEQASDEFDSSLQYGAVVYGKAPGFYFEAADLIGWDTLTDALASFIAQNSFALVSTDSLRNHLVDAAGRYGDDVGDLWDRWFREAKGDEDIEPVDLFGGLGDGEGLSGLEDLDLENLDIEDLLGGLDLDELFGEDAAAFDEMLEELLGEDAELFDQLLEDLLEGAGGN